MVEATVLRFHVCESGVVIWVNVGHVDLGKKETHTQTHTIIHN